MYNKTLEVRQDSYRDGISLSLYDTQALLPEWSIIRPSLRIVYAQVLQNVQVRVNLAFQSFFQRVNSGSEKVGYPRFKSSGRYDSITFPQYGNGVRIDGNDIIISKVGRVRVVWHRPIEGTPKTVTLSRSRTGKWYACFSCEVEAQRLPPVEYVVGVDMGLMSFMTTSDGDKVENPRFYRTDEADLKRVQKQKDAAKNDRNWDENRRRKKALAHIHERIANRRSDFANQISRQVVGLYQVIVFEELAPLEMGKSRGMRKSIQDVAWSQFINMTISKAEEAGRTVVLVDPRNTSKMCSSCGKLVEKKLSDRTHICPCCGLSMDRDLNAAINILQRGLQTFQT